METISTTHGEQGETYEVTRAALKRIVHTMLAYGAVGGLIMGVIVGLAVGG